MLKETAEWLKQAKYDLDTAQAMFESHRYIYTVFMCHLAVEKTIKALFVERTGEAPPKTHNLIYLLSKTQPVLPEMQTKFIAHLNFAAVTTRYPIVPRK